jgi:hypothetical protein
MLPVFLCEYVFGRDVYATSLINALTGKMKCYFTSPVSRPYQECVVVRESAIHIFAVWLDDPSSHTSGQVEKSRH